jgi:hypothetical protein
MYTDLSFKVSQLRAKNQNAMLTAVAVLIAALFVTALLPSLLIQYVYAGQQLFKQPVLLEYIPVISFVLGLGSFLVAAVGNTLRSKRIKFLENQLETEGCACCEDDDEVLAELESLAEALVAEKKKPAKKKAAPKKKPAKK